MSTKFSPGVIGNSLASPKTPATSLPQQSPEHPDLRYVPISDQTKDGSYNGVPGTEAGHRSAGLSSPALSTLASPGGPFKSLEEVKSFSDMNQTDTVLKRRIRLLKFLLRLATVLLALYMVAAMALTLRKFFTTRNHIMTVPGPNGPLSRGPWARQTKTWPTTVLLVTSTLSLVVSTAVMVSYVRSVRAANRADEYGSCVSFAIFATHMGMWIAVAAAYRAGKDGNDLWGWTCDQRARQIQPSFKTVINFRRYCGLQTSSWITSLAQAVLLLLYVAVYAWGYLRLKNQRHMRARFDPQLYHHSETIWTRFVPTKP